MTDSKDIKATDSKAAVKNQAAVKNKAFAVFKIIILIAIVVGIPLYIYLFHKDVLAEINTFDKAVEFLRQYKTLSVPVYFLAEILQIMISVLPGQLFQFAAGYLFGLVPGIIYTFIGAALGTLVTFYLARFLGTDAVHMMLGSEKTKYYIERLNSKKAYLITFLIYLIPGFPKDIVCYVAGVSEIKFRPFLIISLAGRMPAMIASIVFGSMYMKQNYVGMGIVAAVVGVIFIICVLKRKQIMSRVDDLYEKFH